MKKGDLGDRVCIALRILILAAAVILIASDVANMPWSLLGRTM